MASVATLVLFVTGWGSAAASSMLNVFVTNTAAHPVPVNVTNTDANGNLKVHEQGTADVQGTVTSRPTAPASPFTATQESTGDEVTLFGPTSALINVTAITASSRNSAWAFDLRRVIVSATAPSCSGTNVLRSETIWYAHNATEPVSVPFPTPLQVRPAENPGEQVCPTGAVFDFPAGSFGDISVSGFTDN